RAPTGTERYRPRRRSQGCGTSPQWPPPPAPQPQCAPSPQVGQGLDAARGAAVRLGCARRPRPHPAAGPDAQRAPSFIDHDYRGRTIAHQVVGWRVEQDAYREASRDPYPVEGTFDMRQAAKRGADIRRYTPAEAIDLAGHGEARLSHHVDRRALPRLYS